MYWLTGIAGALLMAAPYLFSFSDNTAALWTSLLTGFVVLAASVWEGFEKGRAAWEYWIAAAVGVFAVVAPFILGFGSHQIAMWTMVIMGLVIAVLAGSKLWTETSSGI